MTYKLVQISTFFSTPGALQYLCEQNDVRPLCWTRAGRGRLKEKINASSATFSSFMSSAEGRKKKKEAVQKWSSWFYVCEPDVRMLISGVLQEP